MEGQLKKKGGLFGDSSWKDRYFVLEGRALRYFAGGSTEGKPEGEVTVAGVDAREELQGAKGHKPHRVDFVLEDGGVLCPVSFFAIELKRPLDLDVAGMNLLYLGVECVVYFAICLLIEVALTFPAVAAIFQRVRDPGHVEQELDEDVAAEAQRGDLPDLIGKKEDCFCSRLRYGREVCLRQSERTKKRAK